MINFFRLTWLPALLLVLLIVVWELAVRAWAAPDLIHKIYPLPSGIAEAMWSKSFLLLQNSWVTLQEILIGLSLALVLGFIVALLIFYSSTLERLLYPIIILTQNVPVFAIAPLLVIWMGFNIWPKVVVAALIAFFPMVVNTVDGLRSTEPDLIQLFKILGADRWQRLIHLRIPAALPLIFSGIKIGVTLSVVGAVVGEWVSSEVGIGGLGRLMMTEKRLLHVDTVFAAILWLALLGLMLFMAVSLLERWALRWKHAAEARYNLAEAKEA